MSQSTTLSLALIRYSTGKQGVGLGKRAPSPGALERLAKTAKLVEETDHATFRSRARQDYEERRAEGRLHSALRTLVTLDEQAGVDVSKKNYECRLYPWHIARSKDVGPHVTNIYFRSSISCPWILIIRKHFPQNSLTLLKLPFRQIMGLGLV